MTKASHLHIADCDTIIPAVPHDLILDLLPALHAPLNEHLRAHVKRLPAKLPEFHFVLHKTATKSAKRIRSAVDDRVMYPIL